MTESIPTSNYDHDDTFFGIAEALRADADLSAQIETVLQDLIAAESWETMSARSAERAKGHGRDLVPVPVAAPVSVALPVPVAAPVSVAAPRRWRP